MARASKLTQEEKDEIIRLRTEFNVPYGALAVRFGVSSSTIMRICRPEYAEQTMRSNREYQARNLPQINERLKERYRNVQLKFHVINDKEVLDYLDKLENVQDYVRQKVLADITSEKKQDSES